MNPEEAFDFGVDPDEPEASQLIDDEDPDALGTYDWPMPWQRLEPGERWMWFQQLWDSVCWLRLRYDLPVRTRWWESGVLVETLAALAEWVSLYDTGRCDDPPGKLALLFELERISDLLRDGNEPFRRDRDRAEFEDHLDRLGCVIPDRI